MRKLGVIICLSLVVAPCLTAEARDVVGASSLAGPPDATRQIFTTPGLWEITATVDGEAVPGTSRACIDLELQKKHDIFAQVAPANAGCDKPRRTPVAGGFNYQAVCKMEGATSTVAGELRGDARHVVISSKGERRRRRSVNSARELRSGKPVGGGMPQLPMHPTGVNGQKGSNFR